VGIFQIKILDADAGTAEWGFALGAAYWGTGLFMAGAHPVVDFAFAQMGVRRLEARACLANGRGNGALRKLGAVPETVLHGSFERHGERLDQALWTIEATAWWAAKGRRRGTTQASSGLQPQAFRWPACAQIRVNAPPAVTESRCLAMMYAA